MTGPGSWVVERITGSARDLHDRPFPDGTARLIEVCEVTRPALVLGSTQRPDLVDRAAARAAGIEVAVRRSGGGAVLLDPVGSVWIDVTVPRLDVLWDPDVGRSFHWLGERWLDALQSLGLEGEVHRGGLDRTTGASLVCFAGTGPGEVHIEGRKVVGISQRRTRAAARFQSVVYLTRTPPVATIVDLLTEPVIEADRRVLRAHLEATVGTLEAAAPAVSGALIASLTSHH